MRKKIQVTGIEQTTAIDKYIAKKLSVLESFVGEDDSAIAEVEIGKQSNHHRSGLIYFAEINLHITGKNLRAVNEAEDLYSAIDQVKDDIQRQVVSYHDKRRAVGKKGRALVKAVLKGQLSRKTMHA